MERYNKMLLNCSLVCVLFLLVIFMCVLVFLSLMELISECKGHILIYFSFFLSFFFLSVVFAGYVLLIQTAS